MKHYYCMYKDSKIIQISWDNTNYELQRNVSWILIQSAFEQHLENLKLTEKALPCQDDQFFCILLIHRINMMVQIEYIIADNVQSSYSNNEKHSIMNVITVTEIDSVNSCCGSIH